MNDYIYSPRRTGRTRRMMREAQREALSGRRVLIVAESAPFAQSIAREIQSRLSMEFAEDAVRGVGAGSEEAYADRVPFYDHRVLEERMGQDFIDWCRVSGIRP